jgi:hypothetical protein
MGRRSDDNNDLIIPSSCIFASLSMVIHLTSTKNSESHHTVASIRAELVHGGTHLNGLF